ncbi:MAG: SpoIIE family protein phosphatase [Chromatiales bacterium]|jgi:sigma-B regulation protein RsbU (phosphoserine phosphatase)|nr:SpoIIE family protein phosphatase [Chromatiales bacterium]MDX9766230.1 SpoIIE family protein phosphatase [Ectothiorhodospiraceae bacterium]
MDIPTLRNSIGPKIALLIAAILAASTLIISLFSGQAVERAMLAGSEESVTNMHQTVNRMLESEYRNLQEYRDAALNLRREQLQNVSAAIIATLDELHAAAERGTMTRAAARATALDMLRHMRFFNNDYFFTYDREMTAVAHPDPTFEGRNLIDFQDAKGKYVLREIRDIALELGAGYLEYWWKRLDAQEPAPKIGYVFHHPQWDWIIGTGVYSDDIEAEVERMFQTMRSNLAHLFQQISFANSGFFFVLDGKGEVAIAPEGRDLGLLADTDHGRALTGELLDGLRSANGEVIVLVRDARLRGDRSEAWEFRATRFAPLDWYLISAVAQAEMEAPARSLVTRQIALNVAVLVIGLLIAALVVNRTIRHLKTLTTHARLLPSMDFSLSRSQMSEIEELPKKTQDEVGQLAESILFLERELTRYIQNLTATTAAKERIESELRIAHDIQMGILPKLFPAFPDHGEFDIYAMIEPAREVGGDLYDFFFIDDQHFCFVIGDVSGKGVPAAFFMAVTKTLFKAVAERGLEPGEVLSRVNDDLADDNDSCMFVTLFCAILDVRTGELRYASAGHNPPVLMRAGGTPAFLPVPAQPVAGGLDGVEYHTEKVMLHSGDLLFMYTDGVNEAMDRNDEIYGDERLLATLTTLHAANPGSSIRSMMDDVKTHTQGAEQSDDITMMALQFYGPQGGREPA